MLIRFSCKRIKVVNKVGRYQLDHKGKIAVTKFHEKQTPAKFDKKNHR